jgi:hypothetical protein
MRDRIGIGDIIKLQFRISSQEIDVPVISCAIRIIGDNAGFSLAELDSLISSYEFLVTALRPDKFELAGVGFQSLEKVKFFFVFQGWTLAFHCEQGVEVTHLD